jgi:hypothetical protein
MSDPYYSDAANAKMAALEAKEARGEEITFLDLAGILEPNPDLPDCQSCGGRQCRPQPDPPRPRPPLRLSPRVPPRVAAVTWRRRVLIALLAVELCVIAGLVWA